MYSERNGDLVAEKCPLCGSALAGNICESCGYALPRDEELAALYNLGPVDYPRESPVREIIPEHISEEIYPNRKGTVVKVRRRKAVRKTQDTSQSLSEFLCDDAAVFKEAAAVPQKPIVIKVHGRNMRLTAGYVPNTRLWVKRVEKKAYVRSVSFGETLSAFWWLLVMAVISPTLATIALIISTIKAKGKINIKFVALLFAAEILRIIITMIMYGYK